MQFKNRSFANRGMDFENMVNRANAYYINTGQCAVIKVPTPWKILWKNCNGYRVPLKAWPEAKSWLDYIGCINGKPITFDAKECKNKTSFPLANIKPHQMQELKTWVENGGRAFILVRFTEHQEIYLLPCAILMEYYEQSLNGGRKSIPYSVFEKKCFKVASNRMIYCDWILAYKEWEVHNELRKDAYFG